MDETPKLVPSSATALGEPTGRWPGAFGPRFFTGLLVGLVWLGPAWWDRRFLYAMAAWDVLLVLAWLTDWLRLPRPGEIEVNRHWRGVLSQGTETAVAIEARQEGTVAIDVVMEDSVPSLLSSSLPSVSLRLPGVAKNALAAGRGDTVAAATAKYPILPARRGDIELGGLFIRYQSRAGIAQRWAVADLAQRVRVYPNLQEAQRHTLYLIRSRQLEMERRLRRQRGHGREFESLREYRDGDDRRDICWTASARRGKLVTKVYRVERSQSVVIVIDAGRLMLAPASLESQEDSGLSVAAAAQMRWFHSNSAVRPSMRPHMTKLDCAVTAALALASVALYSGDSVGLLAYTRRIQSRLEPARGTQHLRTFLEQLAIVGAEPVEADHARAADALVTRQRRRSLVVWLTDLAETAATPEVIESASRLLPRHLLLFAAIGQPLLHEMVVRRPESIQEMYRYAAAQELLERRQLLLRRLRSEGALAMELAPGALATALVNQYLEIKDRNLL